MEFEHAAIALLASTVLVLAGMVGWLYWQQTRIFKNMNNIVMAIGELAQRQLAAPEPEPEPVEEVDVPTVPEPEPAAEDDRVSVEDEEKPATAVVDGPVDNDDLEGKTTVQLREILTKRGIPFGKRDSKTVLISLLKATS
jgi:hypothetical protein